jgi:hypothetical protein
LIFFLGLDNTGKPGKSGTGKLAQELGLYLQARGLARLVYVTAHQLLPPGDELPGSTLNHAYCLTLEGDALRKRDIDMESRVFINRNFSAGSNPGFALAQRDQVNQHILSYAKACRMLVMQRSDATHLSRENGITTIAFAGNGNGVIGALAAIGWRWQGSDGTITWMPGLADLNGVMTFSEILQHCMFDHVKSVRGKTPFFEDRIQLGSKVTPLLKEERTLMLLEIAPRKAEWEWTALGLEEVRRINW